MMCKSAIDQYLNVENKSLQKNYIGVDRNNIICDPVIILILSHLQIVQAYLL